MQKKAEELLLVVFPAMPPLDILPYVLIKSIKQAGLK